MSHVTASEIIQGKLRAKPPHVVILGAGASLAAFPRGDANGKQLPLMNNLVSTLRIYEDLIQYKPELRDDDDTYNLWCRDFEACYSDLHDEDSQSPLIKVIEQKVRAYFHDLALPDHATLYDQLILSLREKDAIFTFNWDPFLVDAWVRNQGVAQLPAIFHLHGNVRLRYCDKCECSHVQASVCMKCGGELKPTRLLYPVRNKKYGDDPFIHGQWEAARDYLKDAMLVTILGYSAPVTDTEAKGILHEAWKGEGQDLNQGHNNVKRVEIIDIGDPEQILHNWSPFNLHSNRIDGPYKTIAESRLSEYPRRACEAVYYNSVEGEFTENFPVERSLEDLQKAVCAISQFES